MASCVIIGVYVSSSCGSSDCFLAMTSPNWGFETMVSYWVGFLALCPPPNLEKYNFVAGFTPLRGVTHA
jgi:hypothetical protein